jgi:hypothetical protein
MAVSTILEHVSRRATKADTSFNGHWLHIGNATNPVGAEKFRPVVWSGHYFARSTLNETVGQKRER